MVVTSIGQLLSEKCVVQGIESACLLYATDNLVGEALFTILVNFLLSVLVYAGPFIFALSVYKAKVVCPVLTKYCPSSPHQRLVVSWGLYGVFALSFNFLLSAMLVRVTLPLIFMSLEVFFPINDATEIYNGFISMLPNWIDTQAVFILDHIFNEIRIS